MKKLLQNASGQLKILPFHSNCTKMFCTIFFFSSLSYQKQRKSKFCLGEMRFCLGELGFGGGRIRIWWGAIQKILVGRWNSSPSSPPHTHTHTKENPDPPGCLPSQGKFREFFFLEKSGKSQEN